MGRIFNRADDEPLSPEDTATMQAIEDVAREHRAETAAETTGLPAVPEWPAAFGRHNHDPLPVLARLRADTELAGLTWQVRPVSTMYGPDLLGTRVVLDVEHLRDAATAQAASDARRMVEHFAAQEPVSRVVADEEPGLRGRTRMSSSKRIGGLDVTVAVTLPKDTPLSLAAPPTEGFAAVPEATPVASTSPEHPYIGPMYERPAALIRPEGDAA